MLEVLPAGTAPRAGALVDVEDVLRPWMQATGVSAVAVRPDAIVYAAHGRTAVLGQPPLLAQARPAALAS